ncbi:hypothetical protein [Photobacterium leiognathi]|uniref:hypothetical protein n=1 Tax=Photobacterium leiognathi TaxID=553611 RepID=UPI003AF3F181
MVLKLNTPDLVENEFGFIDKIVSERTIEPNKSYFENYKEKWKDRVFEYEFKNGNPEIILDSTEIEYKKRYINLYGSKDTNKYQTPIINSLRSRELQLCPACGEDGTPNTLDHYLPKDKYPEYAILSKNLFPMCDICQEKKSTKVLCDEGKRIFLHPYYDNFLVKKSVTLNIGKPYNAPECFELSASNLISTEEAILVNKHIKELKIDKRFSKYFKDQYFRLLKLVKKTREDGNDVVQVVNNFVLMSKMKSINSWEHIFYSGVRNNHELMNYLINSDIGTFR